MDSNYGSVGYYQYQRIDLSTDAIRLVRLFGGYREEPIQCELVETFLHKVDGLPYEALSYAWGKPSDEHTYTIFINDRKALVWENLHIALLALRQQSEDRLLWIDAICIDQGNHKEKGHQVGQMRQIYEHAQQVLIWLGPSNLEIDLFMNLAGMWDYRTRQGPGARHEQTWIDSWNSLTSNETGIYKEEVTTRRRNSLQEILNRPWFRRVWIIQEAASASRATILCGSKALSSQGFSLLPYLLGLELDSSTQAILDILPSYRRQKTWWGEKNNLETLLMKFTTSEATDPRDNIYALLGIASDARASNTLRPDYEIPLDRAICNTISFLLFQEVREPSSLPLPMNLNIDAFHRFLPRLREYVVSWAVLHDHDATATAVMPQLTDITKLPNQFSVQDFDAYFCPLRNLVVNVLKEKVSCSNAYLYSIRTVFQRDGTAINPSELIPLLLVYTKIGNLELAKFILELPCWEIQDMEALLFKAAGTFSLGMFQDLFTLCQPLVLPLASQTFNVMFKEAASICRRPNPLARLSHLARRSDYSVSNVENKSWRIVTIPNWMVKWLDDLKPVGKEDQSKSNTNTRDTGPKKEKDERDPVHKLYNLLSDHKLDDKANYLELVVAALIFQEPGINISINMIRLDDSDNEANMLLPTQRLPSKYLLWLSTQTNMWGVSQTVDERVRLATMDFQNQTYLYTRPKLETEAPPELVTNIELDGTTCTDQADKALQQEVDVGIVRQIGGLGRYISKLQALWESFTSRL